MITSSEGCGAIPPLAPLSSLCGNRKGAAAVEFALVAPTFLFMLFSMFDLGHLIYANSILTGAVQAAARSSSLENGDTTAADTMVRDRIRQVMPNLTMSSSRKSYFDFSDVERPEIWNDANANGSCDNNENYTDENDNSGWDRDIGTSGNGGASDVVLYTVTANYQSMFTSKILPSDWASITLSSTAVRKNQPYANQAARGSRARTCA